MPTLKVRVPGAALQYFRITKPTLDIGRHPDCDVVLPGSMVSRHHARLVQLVDGFEIEDLGSRNGTSVNGKRILKPTHVSTGDSIYIDRATIVLTEDGTTEQPAAIGGHDGTDEDLADRIPLIDQRQLLRETVSDREFIPAEAPDQSIAPRIRLEALLEVSRDLGNPPDPPTSLARILDSVFRAFPQAERGYVLEKDSNTGEISIASVKFRDEADSGDVTLGPLFRRIARRVLTTGAAILSAGGDDERHDQEREKLASASVLDLQSPSVLCAPMIGPSRQTLGVIYVEAGETQFDTEDLDVLSCIAILAGQTLEQAWSQSRRYRAVVDTAVDAIVTVNESGTIESANPAVEGLFGYDHKELIGRNVRMLLPSPEENSFDQAIQRYVETGEAQCARTGCEVTGRRKDGSTFPIHLSLGEFELDGRQFFTGILHDISEQKRWQKQLMELNETLEKRVEERTASMRLLQQIAIIANEAESVAQALRLALSRICQMCNWPIGHAWLPAEDDPNVFCDSELWFGETSSVCEDLKASARTLQFRAGQGMVGGVIASGKPMWLSDVGTHDELVLIETYRRLGICSAFAFPVLVDKDVVAVLEFFMRDDLSPDTEFLQAIAHAGTQLGRVIERRRLQRELVDAVWTQQRRFGQEVHDSLGQGLTGIRMLLEAVRRKLRKQPLETTDAALDELTHLIQSVQNHARRLSKGLFPVDIFEGSLVAALQELAETVSNQAGVSCAVQCRGDVEVAGHDVATHLFRIAQEATNNAVKYSGGDRIQILLQRRNRDLLLEVRDNGRGITGDDDPPKGMGLRIMRYRAGAIGGRWSIQPMDGGGTAVRCVLRFPRAERWTYEGANPAR